MAGSSLVQSLLKGIDILTFVSETEDGARLSEICDHFNLKVPTAHNLVRTLVARSFLAKTSANRYVSGSAIDQIAERRAQRNQTNAATVAVTTLANLWPSGTVTYSTVEGSNIVVVLRMSPDQPGFLQKSREQTFNLYANASGLIFQAFASEDQLSNLRERFPFHEYGAHLWKDASSVTDFLAEVRAAGFARHPFSDPGNLRLAVPVFSRWGALAGALGMSITDEYTDDDEVVSSILRIAGECSGRKQQE